MGTKEGNRDGASDGTKVGESVGSNVGSNVGSSVGSRVGAKLGIIVGIALGHIDGTAVGTPVGFSVGSDVGRSVGCAVGAKEGSREGKLVGPKVGMEVGANVGRLVGSSVGTGVGGRVYSTMTVEADVSVAFKSGEAFWKSVALVPFCLFANAVKLFAKLPLSIEATNVSDSDVATSSAVPLKPVFSRRRSSVVPRATNPSSRTSILKKMSTPVVFLRPCTISVTF